LGPGVSEMAMATGTNNSASMEWSLRRKEEEMRDSLRQASANCSPYHRSP